MRADLIIQCDGRLLGECQFAVMGERGMYLKCIDGNTVKLCRSRFEALWFYNESAAYELSLELQCWTHRWFGVVEL